MGSFSQAGALSCYKDHRMSEIFIPGAAQEKSVENAVKVAFIERLMIFSKTHDMWDTIDYIVEAWTRSNPEYATDHYDMVKDKRSVNFDEFGSNRKTKSGNTMDFRHLAEVPLEVFEVIEILFRERISEMGKRAFWQRFSRRYRQFAPNEKI